MSRMPRADFWFSILLSVFGAAIVFESWRMPRLKDLGIDPLSAPGITPGLLGIVLTGLGIGLFVRSLKATPSTEAGEGGWGRFALALGLCLVYAVILVGRMPFWLATALFLALFVGVFLWGQRSPLAVALRAVALAVPISVAVTLLFERVFLVQLP